MYFITSLNSIPCHLAMITKHLLQSILAFKSCIAFVRRIWRKTCVPWICEIVSSIMPNIIGPWLIFRIIGPLLGCEG